MAKLPHKQWETYLEWLYDYEHEKLKIPRADLTLYLDVPLSMSQVLLQNRPVNDIHESDLKYRKRCYEAATTLLEREKWHRIDCINAGSELRTPEEINEELLEVIGL
jgi:dTMP kinase